MTQHYGVSAGPKINLLSSDWMQLTDAATNRPVYYHKATSQMVLPRAEMFLKSPPVTPLLAPRNSLSPAPVQSFELPNEAVSAPFPPAHTGRAPKGRTKKRQLSLFSRRRACHLAGWWIVSLRSHKPKNLKRKTSVPPVIRQMFLIQRLHVTKV
jgi:hypothetical protein